MQTKELIIQLIAQDMKHCQLVFGLKKLGIDSTTNHMLQIPEIVFDLFETSSLDKEKWIDIYMDFMLQTVRIPVKSNAHNLMPFAETCYKKLIELG